MNTEELKQLCLDTGALLKAHHLTVTTAESCTGGGLAYWLTHLRGSSEWYDRGFITYSNDAKIKQLDVSSTIIKQYGAVSQETAAAMAIGALNNSTADISVAVTGIAGPDGGSHDKPVGTVWIGCMRRGEDVKAFCYEFSGDRQQIRLQAIVKALHHIQATIKAAHDVPLTSS
jgi:nicotinamide-nucleotide amidase